MSYQQRIADSILRSAVPSTMDDLFFLSHQRELRDELIADRRADKESIAYKCGQFVKGALFSDPAASRWLREKKITIAKAQSSDVNASGGVLVPAEVAAVVLALLEQYGTIRREATSWPMNSDQLTVPRIVSAWTPKWLGQNVQVTTSVAGFDSLTLSARKLAAACAVSSELIEDAEAFGQALILGLSEAFMQAEDDAAFNGDGTSTYGGVNGLANAIGAAGKYTSASGHITYGTLDHVDITGMMGLLPARALPNAKFYCSQTAFSTTFTRLSAANGNALAMTPTGPAYLGFPIVISQKLPLVTSTLANKAMMFFGDMKRAVAFGSRREFALRTITESSLTQLDQDLVMGIERVDIVCGDVGDATTAGAMVALFAAAS